MIRGFLLWLADGGGRSAGVICRHSRAGHRPSRFPQPRLRSGDQPCMATRRPDMTREPEDAAMPPVASDLDASLPHALDLLVAPASCPRRPSGLAGGCQLGGLECPASHRPWSGPGQQTSWLSSNFSKNSTQEMGSRLSSGSPNEAQTPGSSFPPVDLTLAGRAWPSSAQLLMASWSVVVGGLAHRATPLAARARTAGPRARSGPGGRGRRQPGQPHRLRAQPAGP